MKESLRSDQLGWYCLLMQLLYGALLAMVYTDDLFTAYVFVEIAAVTACIAVAARESGRSILSAIRYLMLSCLGSGLILLGISILYSITGHLLFDSLEGAVAALAESRTYFIPLVVSALLMTLGLSIKSAQFPFHAWLPDAHASTFTASSAILSGLVLKGYLVIILKLVLRVFSPALLVSICMDDLLFLLGLAGMLFASVAALRQEEVKRMIAYSSSAQISYIFLALGLGSTEGLIAACYQILAHAMTKSMIFLGAGEMIRASGGHYWGGTAGCGPAGPSGRAGLYRGGTVPVRLAPAGGLFRQILHCRGGAGGRLADLPRPVRAVGQLGAQRHVLHPRHPGHLGPEAGGGGAAPGVGLERQAGEGDPGGPAGGQRVPGDRLRPGLGAAPAGNRPVLNVTANCTARR